MTGNTVQVSVRINITTEGGSMELKKALRLQRQWLREAHLRGDVRAEMMLENVIKRNERMLVKSK